MTKELIAKLEALKEPEAGVFHEAFKVIYPEPEGLFATDKQLLDRQNWLVVKALFSRGLACQVWSSAAIMLVPEGLHECLDNDPDGPRAFLQDKNKQQVAMHYANHPAIALLICILKAKESVE